MCRFLLFFFKSSDNKSMKKIILCFCFLLISFFAFAETDSIVRTDLGFSTGIPVYSHRDDTVTFEESRAIIGTFADISFKLGQPLRFLFGADVMSDFMWGGTDYNYHLDYAGWAGIKFYPGFGGLNFSISYALGSRTDFVSVTDKKLNFYDYNGSSIPYFKEESDTYVESTAWGNGFRISFDYDFLYGNDNSFAPALGGYYRCMPRGNDNWDNIFAVYISFGF